MTETASEHATSGKDIFGCLKMFDYKVKNKIILFFFVIKNKPEE